MLNRLISWSLQARGLVLLAALALLVAGARVASDLPLEVFPELNAPTITIMTEAPGLAADEVETAVTFPLETAVNGLPDLRRVRSTSTSGLSMVWAEFGFGTDIYRARQLVAERLARVAGTLPDNVHPPSMSPVASLAGEIMLLGLTSDDASRTPLELRRIAEFDLRPRLLAIAGIAQVTTIGGLLPEYQVLARPLDLLRFRLTLHDVEAAAAAAHAPAGGGYLADVDGRELPIRPLARASSADDLKSTIVGDWRGTPVRLDAVADVQLGGAPRRGTGSVAGQPAVILAVQRNPDVNTLELTERIDRALDSFAAALPSGIRFERSIFRQADFIEAALRNVLHAVRDGALFVVLVLVLFLLNVRTTLITLTALPLSLVAAVLVLRAFGETLNVMTLGGIAVAIGSLVDDAIVDVENVFRRLRENRALPPEQQRQALRVVLDASIEVRPAIVLATAMIVLFFAPLFFLAGVEGRFFRPLGLAYAASIGASLLVAVTVTPVLCYLLLGRARTRERESPLARWLTTAYARALAVALRCKRAVLASALALVAGAAALASGFGSSFLPEFNEGSLTVFVGAPPGTSLAESERAARAIELRLQAVPGVTAVSRRTGRGELDEHAEPPNTSDIDVRIDPSADVATVRERVVDVLAEVPGLTTQIGGPIAHRLSHILSGTPAAIAIKVFGDDLDTLRAIAHDIDTALRGVPGVRDLVANREVTTDTLPVAFDRDALARVGLTPADAAHQIETAFLGRRLGTVTEGTARIDIVLRLPESSRRTTEDVRAFVLRAPSGALVRLGTVAAVREEPAVSLITRENASRKAVVSCNVAQGHNLGDLVARIRERVDPIAQRHAGVWVEYGGQFEAQQEAERRILGVSLAVLLVVLGMLWASFRSLRPPLLILLNLPLALVGGVVALSWAEPILSIPAVVGFIGLAGVAARNGLLLVSHTVALMRTENLAPEAAVLRGARERLIAILMTALSSALALVPLVVAQDAIGNELQYPLAVVILGGLASSTLLNLFVIPVGFALFGARPQPQPFPEPQ
jgi:CzcA family heavy metal efflux pump